MHRRLSQASELLSKRRRRKLLGQGDRFVLHAVFQHSLTLLKSSAAAWVFFAVAGGISVSAEAEARVRKTGCLTDECHKEIVSKTYVHGPIGSGMCPLCHDRGRKPTSPLDPSHPKVRTDSATSVCLLCHEEIRALMDLDFIHTPVEDGECVDCHDPHQSDNVYFLTHYPERVGTERIIAPACKSCHEAGSPDWYDEFHASESILDCNVCHNAHASSERFQLTRYVRAVYWEAALMESADLYESGDLEGAVRGYKNALSVNPNDEHTLFLLARVHSDQGEWSNAVALYNKLLDRRPDHVEALMGASEAALHLEGSGAALGYLNKAVETSPDRADLRVKIGLIYLERKQYQEAFAQFARAAEINPGHEAAHRHLADVLESMGKKDEAAKARLRYQELRKE